MNDLAAEAPATCGAVRVRPGPVALAVLAENVGTEGAGQWLDDDLVTDAAFKTFLQCRLILVE